MRKPWYISGLLAGLLIYFTGAFCHTALRLGDSALQPIPNETATLTALSERVKQPGLYLFPYEEDMDKAAAAWKAKPHGLLIYSPPGGSFSLFTNLAIQLVTDLALGLVMAWLFLHLRPASIGEGLACGLLLSVLIGLATLAPYWNWYGFPPAFVIGLFGETVLTIGLAGGLLAYLLRPGVPEPVANAARAASL